MDEFERLEKELQALYKNYVERHRNLHYLGGGGGEVSCYRIQWALISKRHCDRSNLSEHQVYLDSRADEARQVQATKALHTLQKKLREDEDQTMLATGEEGFGWRAWECIVPLHEMVYLLIRSYGEAAIWKRPRRWGFLHKIERVENRLIGDNESSHHSFRFSFTFRKWLWQFWWSCRWTGWRDC